MAFTTYGVGPTITAQKWSELFYEQANGGGGEVISQGFAPSVQTGTRKVRIATGTAAAVGCLIESNAVVDVTLDNADAYRLDVICLQIDWTETDASTAASIIVKKGVQLLEVLPSLTRDAGSLWQIPLATVLLLPGVGQLQASALTDIRPTRRQRQVFRPNIDAKDIAGNGSRVLVSERDIEYPGYDYTLDVHAALNMSHTGQGFGQIEIEVSGGGADTTATGRAPDQNTGLAYRTWASGRMTAFSSVSMYMRPMNMLGSATLSSFATHSYLQIVQAPF